MIRFDDWTIYAVGDQIARQYDNLSRELIILGEIPEGWDFSLLCKAGGQLNIIDLSPWEEGLRVLLTAEMLSLAGYYTLQLRGTQGEMVRHTNIIRVYVPESMSGDAQWPEVPSAFTQLEAAVRQSAEDARQSAADAANAAAAIPQPLPGDAGKFLRASEDGQRLEFAALPGGGGGSGGSYIIGDGLKLDGSTNTLSVDTATDVEQDNTKPITSAAVYETVGNIEILLGTI